MSEKGAVYHPRSCYMRNVTSLLAQALKGQEEVRSGVAARLLLTYSFCDSLERGRGQSKPFSRHLQAL